MHGNFQRLAKKIDVLASVMRLVEEGLLVREDVGGMGGYQRWQTGVVCFSTIVASITPHNFPKSPSFVEKKKKEKALFSKIL